MHKGAPQKAAAIRAGATFRTCRYDSEGAYLPRYHRRSTGRSACATFSAKSPHASAACGAPGEEKTNRHYRKMREMERRSEEGREESRLASGQD